MRSNWIEVLWHSCWLLRCWHRYRWWPQHPCLVAVRMHAGTIPTEIGSMRKLKFVDLSNNLLEGPVPTEICSLRRLEELVLSQNKFTGACVRAPSTCVVLSCAVLQSIHSLYALTMAGDQCQYVMLTSLTCCSPPPIPPPIPPPGLVPESLQQRPNLVVWW